jgi:hypothetical protein
MTTAARSRRSAKTAGTRFETAIAAALAAALGDDRIERRTRNGTKDRGDIGGVPMSEDTPDEAWADVAGFEGYYQISNRRNVRSLPRVVPVQGQVPRRLQARILRPSVRRSDGRQHVALSRNGQLFTRNVDRLMREAGWPL